MNDSMPDPLDRLWRSAGNSPSLDELDRLRPRLLARLRRERRNLALRLGAAGAALLALSIAWAVARLGGSAGAPGAAAALLLAPPWIAFALFVRRQLRRPTVDARAGAPIRAALASALDETRAALARVRTVALLHLVSMPLLALALRELAATGRVKPHELRSLALVLAGILLAASGLLLHRAFLRLRPRARRLAALLAESS